MFWLVYLSVLVLDQFSKLLATQWLLGSVNSGIAFAWFKQLPSDLMTILVGGVAVLVVGLGRDLWSRYPIFSALFWAGVSSNLLDRLLVGGVVDWWPWPLFKFTNNLADLVLVLGLVGFCFQWLFHHD